MKKPENKNYVLLGENSDLELRDLFAASALTGILSHDYLLPEEAAKAAYRHADAMLTERVQQQQEQERKCESLRRRK